MPILLDEIDLSADALAAIAAKTDPKFFSSKLTGNGKKTGLLNEALLPVNTATNTAYAAADNIELKTSRTQHDITTTAIPFAPITRRALTEVGGDSTLAVPGVGDRFVVDAGPSAPCDIFFDMTPQASTMWEYKSGDVPTRDFVVQYRMELFILPKGTTPEPERAFFRGSRGINRALPGAQVCVEWDSSPLDSALDFIDGVLRGLLLNCRNTDDLGEWMREYSIYERITRLAQTWNSTAIADEVMAYVDAIPGSPSNDQLNALALQLRYLENYNVPLDAYRMIHQKLDQAFPDDVVTGLSKQNLNLLMNYTLDKLDQMKPQLAVPARPAAQPALPAHLSNQQLDAITTHEPLVMTQAGAGTGKSTVILERIAYLETCGVSPEDITVLSFTNAAADNITAKNPAVGSMTIARMINDIYTLNHPTHELSSIDTIINSIDIFFPTSRFAASFRQRLLEVDQNKTGAYTGMNTFIESNYDQVINVLDTIKQTSLELEIIICYQQIDTMIEPSHVRCRHLIIDEVQDNSIFEFIYVLKYIGKHSQSLFIVGDASQTLYEFRSANPRALNTLESSKVFATFRLTTNYRSNQEILDFANVVLGELETNQFAGIQLQANSLAVPTAATFQEKVKLRYEAVQKLNPFIMQDLPVLLGNVVIPNYVQGCLDRDEQVAFLAYSRREVAMIQGVLEARYPDRHVANLVSEKVYSTDIFSKYIKFFWNDVLQVPPNNASFVVHQGIKDNLDKLTKNAGNPNVEKAVVRMISNWWVENNATVNHWVTLCQQGSLPYAEFFDRLRDNLLTYEIRHNAVRQSLINQKNRERKAKNAESKAELVVSTIHGAKGLEFDNVVVIHKEDTKMSQDTKRMFYVAFTRAMNTEYVLSYGTVKNPPIQSQYEQIVNVLTQRDEAAAQLDQGIDMDDVDETADAVGLAEPAA